MARRTVSGGWRATDVVLRASSPPRATLNSAVDNPIREDPEPHTRTMSFEDLPSGWDLRPLWQNELADVVDLLLGDADRRRDAMLVVYTDREGIAIPEPMLVDGMPWARDPEEAGAWTGPLFQLLASEGSSVLIGIGHRAGGVTLHDLRWCRFLTEAMERHCLRSLGVYVADPARVTRVSKAAAEAA